ncbi:MAG: antitoxin [Actinomycetota bacterium]|jgi:hypothetical protein|nr:antitoxin [Actinomycetota bacterium]
MGFLDDARKKLPGLVKGRSKQIEGALDKVADVVDDKTKGKHADKIDSAVDKAKDAVRGLDSEADDKPSGS